MARGLIRSIFCGLHLYLFEFAFLTYEQGEASESEVLGFSVPHEIIVLRRVDGFVWQLNLKKSDFCDSVLNILKCRALYIIIKIKHQDNVT